MKKTFILLLLLFAMVNVAYSEPPTRIYTYSSGQTIDPEKVTANEDAIFNYLNRDIEEIADNSVTSAKIVDGTILNADIGTNAAIAYSKLNLASSIGAGDIAATAVSAGSYTNTDLTVDADGRITSASSGTVALASEVSGTLPVGNGGTGATAAANAANGVVVLNASSQLPAVSGALLTNLPTTKTTLGFDSGTASLTTGQSLVINFNFTYSVAPIVVICPVIGAGVNPTVQVVSTGTTSFTAYNGYGGTLSINWIAMGTHA